MQARLQAKTVAQLRDFVGKLGGLKTEHEALRLREYLHTLYRDRPPRQIPDTGLSEMLVPQTRTELFNKSLEVQQSE